MDEFELRSKTALVTGGAKRLGRAAALALADAGVSIVVHHRDSPDEAAGVCEEVHRRGVRAWSLQADFADPAAADTLFAEAVALAGPVQVLINSASAFDSSNLGDMVFSQVTDDAAINAWAPFAMGRAFAAQGLPGRIVNMLDAALEGYVWEHVAYILSKQMLALLTRMTALEYAPDITVNAISPGFILPPPGLDEQSMEPLIARVPLRRHGEPEDIVAALVFLLKSDYITGQVIYVDGGTHLRGGP